MTLATGDRVLGAVSEALDIPVVQLRGQVSAENPAKTVLIDVRATSPDGGESARIANAVADELVGLVASVENGEQEGASLAPVSLTHVQEATVPHHPYSPNLSRNIMLGVVGGALLGFSTALLRDRFDTRLRGRDDIAAVTQASVLGEFSSEAASGQDLILKDLASYSGRTEAYRQLRTHLQFMNVDGGVRSILVSSSIPAEGKSTTAANLAITLAEGGVRVLLIDADLRRPKIDSLLGLERTVGLTTVLTGRIGLADAVQPAGPNSSLVVLTSGTVPPNPSELLASAAMERLLHAAQESFDVVIVDSPPLVGVSDPAGLSTLVSGVLLVTSADGRLRREQLTYALEQLSLVRAKLFGLVLNRAEVERRKGYYEYGYEIAEPPKHLGRGRRRAARV
ncbi:polysaccharide biosynthesis tyrosine autokinase [Leucobacter aridicollis]|uniref:polysaccharide biosynthesis tyrosine autokinase n=1 Tax=Leucobacter aridicollis TaxID=283878 RepID=UPI0027DB4E00|nr:polysaccharide biosynthesis tyrosine autokinase [Leucobacter aridicollis]